MPTWTRQDIKPNVLGIDGILKTIKTIAEAAQLVLDPIITVIDALITLLGATDTESIDIEFILSKLLLSIEILHLYPAQNYQVMSFTQWAYTVERSFQLGTTDERYNFEPAIMKSILGEDNANCLGPGPYRILIVGVADPTIKGLQDAMKPLQDLFGQARSGIEDIAKELDRTLLRSKPSNCSTLLDLLPVVGVGLAAIEGSTTITAPSVYTVMRRALVKKLENIQLKIQEINTFLNLLKTLQIPGVWVFEGDVTLLADIASTLLTADNAPGRNFAFAGSAMLGGGNVISVLTTMLGLKNA